MTERVTIEQNGERFTLDVPDGTSDDEIRNFIHQQQSSAAGTDQSQARELTTGEKLAGGAMVGYELAKEHPKTAAVVGDLALAALPQAVEKIPGVGKVVTAAKYPYRLAQAGLEALQKVGGGGAPVAPAPTAAPAPAPVAPPAAAAQPAMPAQAANAARGAATAAQPGNWMAQALNMAQRYAPAMARMGAGLGAATYSGGLNTNEEAELARRRAREVEQARRQGWIQ